MVIRGQCPSCGREFQAPKNLAGKRVKCPQCDAVIQVGGERSQPAKTAALSEESQPISVACDCGKKFRAKPELAGKCVKCPACGQALAIPRPPAASSALPKREPNLQQLMRAEADATPLPSPLLTRPKQKKQRPNLPLMVGLGVGAGVLALAVVLAVTFWPLGEDQQLARNVPTAGERPAVPPGASAPPAPSAASGTATTAGGPPSYPRLPRAINNPPAWLVKDAPFDVVAFFVAPPPEENAAPLYLDALYEFSSEMEECFSAEERARRSATVKQREQRFDEIHAAWKNEPRSVGATAVDGLIAEYDAGFEKLALAQKRT